MTRRKPNELEVPRHDIKKFSWSPTTRTLVAEASDLGHRWMGRIYNDAMDMGFTIINHETGNEVKFALVSEDRDAEGELQGINFQSIDSIFNVKALVIND